MKSANYNRSKSGYDLSSVNLNELDDLLHGKRLKLSRTSFRVSFRTNFDSFSNFME